MVDLFLMMLYYHLLSANQTCRFVNYSMNICLLQSHSCLAMTKKKRINIHVSANILNDYEHKFVDCARSEQIKWKWQPLDLCKFYMEIKEYVLNSWYLCQIKKFKLLLTIHNITILKIYISKEMVSSYLQIKIWW
jgi:hypothetical protein